MTMDNINKHASGSDDEEELEFLRLAALKSLKPKTASVNIPKVHETVPSTQHSFNPTFGAAQTTRNYHKGFRNAGRAGRNGVISRQRTNTNLIAIQTVDPNESEPKLPPPENRYHKSPVADDSPKEPNDKFNRFDDKNSDESESDSEEVKPMKRERKDSLELLMEELENEIQGVGKVDEPKIMDEKSEENPDQIKDEIKTEEVEIKKEPEEMINEEVGDPNGEEEIKIIRKLPSPVLRSRSRSPFCKKRSRSPLPSYRSRKSRTPPRKVRYSPYRPVSPLNINTEILNTITMAPLSPRSAAFVLENRQILARRQMSPGRRSLSRDRSKSPKRMKLSPRHRSPYSRKCSLSPRNRDLSPRLSPKRRSTSPRTNRRSPLPSRYNNSPIHKRLGSRPVDFERKLERRSRSLSLSLSPSPDRNYHKRPLNVTTGYMKTDNSRHGGSGRDKKPKDNPKTRDDTKLDEKLDPVLEARKRKFESPVQIEKNGIIKIKTTKSEESAEPEGSDTFEEDILPPTDENTDEPDDSVLDINLGLDCLLSDDESDNENEGRFKSTKSSTNNPKISFRTLLEKPNIDLSLDTKIKMDLKRKNRLDNNKTRASRNGGSSRRETTSKSYQDEVDYLKSAKNRKQMYDKIKLPEPKDSPKPVESNVVSEATEIPVAKVKPIEKKSRTVKIQSQVNEITKSVSIENVPEPEIIIENDEDSDDYLTKDDDGGDLRAELSRRRAERLIKAGSIADSLPTRLLKNALKEVDPRRSVTKNSKTTKGACFNKINKEINGIGDNSASDRRVLILDRLPTSQNNNIQPVDKVSKKKEKLPIHMRLGLASVSDLESEQRVVKRSRSGRRKKVQV